MPPLVLARTCSITNLAARAETRAVIEEKVQQWVEAFEHCPKPLPPEAHAQRMAIDQLHSEIIHLQEEKFVFAQQVRTPTPTRPCTVDEHCGCMETSHT